MATIILTTICFLETGGNDLRGHIQNCLKKGLDWMSENLYLVIE